MSQCAHTVPHLPTPCPSGMLHDGIIGHQQELTQGRHHELTSQEVRRQMTPGIDSAAQSCQGPASFHLPLPSSACWALVLSLMSPHDYRTAAAVPGVISSHKAAKGKGAVLRRLSRLFWEEQPEPMWWQLGWKKADPRYT